MMNMMTKEQFQEIENLNKKNQQAAVALFKKCLELNDEKNGFHTWVHFSGHVSFISFQAKTKNLNLKFDSLCIKPYSFYPDEQIIELNESLFALKMCKAQLIQMHKCWEAEMPDALDDFDHYANPDDLHEYEHEVDPWDAQMEADAREQSVSDCKLGEKSCQKLN